MFHVELQSKRSKAALRFFTYGVMTFATILISAVFILLALGYRFDNRSYSFEQGGLIQFRSTPQNAVITVDGKRQSFTTPGKLTIPAGKHDITMNLPGYRGWSKSINIAAGQLLWLNYTRFIPNDITTQTVREFDRMDSALISPNRRYAALLQKASEPRITYADIRDEKNPQFQTADIPASAYTAVPGAADNFELIEWQLDGRYLLVRHRAGEVNEVIRLDREQPGQAVNLTAKYGPISNVQFLGSNADIVVAQTGNELRRLDVNGTNSQLLLSGITYFELYRDNLIGFIAERQGVRQAGVYVDGRETVVKEVPLSGSPLKIDVSNYYNDDYLAVADGKTVTIIRKPAEVTAMTPRTDLTFTIDQPVVEWLYFSNNGRMLVAQNQASFTTYDLEVAQTYRRSFQTSQPVTRPFKWFDDYNLYVDLDNALRIVEYDGTNERALASVVPGYPVSISENDQAVFSFAKATDGRINLQRSNLVAGQQ